MDRKFWPLGLIACQALAFIAIFIWEAMEAARHESDSGLVWAWSIPGLTLGFESPFLLIASYNARTRGKLGKKGCPIYLRATNGTIAALCYYFFFALALKEKWELFFCLYPVLVVSAAISTWLDYYWYVNPVISKRLPDERSLPDGRSLPDRMWSERDLAQFRRASS